MPVKQLRVRLSASLHEQFQELLPEHGQRSKAIRKFIRIFVEESKHLKDTGKQIDRAAVMAADEILREVDSNGDI